MGSLGARARGLASVPVSSARPEFRVARKLIYTKRLDRATSPLGARLGSSRSMQPPRRNHQEDLPCSGCTLSQHMQDPIQDAAEPPLSS